MTAPTQLPASRSAAVSQDSGACEPADIVGRVDGDTVPARNAAAIAEVAAGSTIGLDTLPGRDLDQAELLQLASSIAADPAALQEHVAFSDDQRHYVSLHRDTHVDVWLLCWTPQNDTGWHDHDISSGAVAVTQGTLTEHNWRSARRASRPRSTRAPPTASDRTTSTG